VTMESTRESGVQTGDQESAREIMRRGRAFLALVASPRDGATGPHDRGSAHYHELLRLYRVWICDLSRPLAFYALTSMRV
jgi:hypothetical protein